MKKFLFVIPVLILNSICCAQVSKFNELRQSIMSNLIYPRYLNTNCVPSSALIKVSVDSLGRVDIDISDSAEKLLKIEFMSKLPKFKVDFVKQYRKDQHLSNYTLLIPLYFHTGGCAVRNVDADLLRHFTSFNGEIYTGISTMLAPIELVVRQPIR